MIDVDVQLHRHRFELDVAFRSEAPVLGVFGPSGAGKTTLIHLIAGLVRPDAGAVSIGGRPLFDDEQGIDVPVHRRRLGIVFQEHRLFPHYSVRGNLLFGARRSRADLHAVANLLELGPLLSRRIGELSGGEQQRVALGRALLCQPRALLLDEPLASLDQRLRRQILPYLRRVRDTLAVPILCVSHHLADLLELTDELLVLERGRVVGCGRYADLLHEDAVLSVVHDRGMTNVLPARMTAHHPAEGVSALTLVRRGAGSAGGAGGAATGPPVQLVAPLAPTVRVGEIITIDLQPSDIALALQPVPGVSIRNQVHGTVTRCTPHAHRVIVEIDLGTPVIAEISRGSATAMGIKVGRPCICLIKSHAIRYLTGNSTAAPAHATPAPHAAL